MTRGLLNIQNVKFVDDNTALTSCTSIEAPAKEVMVKAQQELDDWQACSKVTGGTLNHAKTATWVLDQVWSNDHWRMWANKSLPGTLHLEDEEGVRCAIKRLKPTEDHKISGMHITGDHTWKAQIPN
jgi:hypothetical protein